jgi:hypothetical protein
MHFDMSTNLRPQFMKVLHAGTVVRANDVVVVVCDDAGFVADAIIMSCQIIACYENEPRRSVYKDASGTRFRLGIRVQGTCTYST